MSPHLFEKLNGVFVLYNLDEFFVEYDRFLGLLRVLQGYLYAEVVEILVVALRPVNKGGVLFLKRFK